MTASTVSSKYQIVIPLKIRESFNIKPGQKVEFVPYHGTIVIVPVKPIEEMFGFLEGMNSNIERDEDDRI